jgi:uncharacterized protein (DUF2384 family)
MNIDDILQKKEFKELDVFLTDEMNKYANQEMMKQMLDVFGDEKKARNWFYSKLIALGNKRPYDFCKKGEGEKVSDALGRMDSGNYA